MNASAAVAAILAVVLAIGAPRASFAADGNAPSDSYKITSGGIGSGNHAVTCNFGLMDEQLTQLTEAVVKGATKPLTHQIFAISKTLGVTEDVAEKLLKIVGEDPNIPEDKVVEALSKVAADYQRLQTQLAALNLDNPTAKALVEQARPETGAGHFEHARELLHQATRAQIAAAQEARKLNEQAQAAEDAQILGAASSTATEGDVALTERRYAEAAELFGQAAGYVPGANANERGDYLARQADALYRRGSQRGDNAALRSSIEAYDHVLVEYPRSRVPFEWAKTQNDLGLALKTLGERESGTARLEEAIAAYRASLEEWTRDRVPLKWAAVQRNLGDALERLGGRERGTARLEEAVKAYRAALEELTRDRTPLEWAGAQNSLGGALEVLGDRESGTARLEDAVAAFRAALEEDTRQRVPFDWAAVQRNLGDALETLGERESGTTRLEEAVAAYRASLEEWTRDRVPLDWAGAQNSLGVALEALGRREGGTARLEEAVAAFRAALEEDTRQRVPLHWASAESNLGTALEALGERESGTARLEEAVQAYRAALEEQTRERVPLDWAEDFGNQGVAIMVIADRTNDGELAATALQQIQTAYEAERSGGQEQWAAYYKAQLPKAQAIRDRLKGK